MPLTGPEKILRCKWETYQRDRQTSLKELELDNRIDGYFRCGEMQVSRGGAYGMKDL